jgi:hypothetical protein
LGAVALLGFAAFVAVSLSVGLRLLRLASRTRELPELAIGVALFAGGVGYSLFILMFSLRANLAMFEASGHRGPFVFWLFNAAGAAAYAWSAFEAFRYHGLLRRRVRVGLARPEIANRFLLLGLRGTRRLRDLRVGDAEPRRLRERIAARRAAAALADGSRCGRLHLARVLPAALLRPPRRYAEGLMRAGP